MWTYFRDTESKNEFLKALHRNRTGDAVCPACNNNTLRSYYHKFHSIIGYPRCAEYIWCASCKRCCSRGNLSEDAIGKQKDPFGKLSNEDFGTLEESETFWDQLEDSWIKKKISY